MCKCMEDTLEMVKSKLALPNHKNDSLVVGWDNSVLRFDTGSIDVMLRINYEYLPTKRDGNYAKNNKKENISIAMSFCPFCGEKKLNGVKS